MPAARAKAPAIEVVLGEILRAVALPVPEQGSIRDALQRAASADTDAWVREEAAACSG